MNKQGIIDRTFLYHEAQVIFACMVSVESKKKKPDYRKLAAAALDAAEAFREVLTERGEFALRPVV